MDMFWLTESPPSHNAMCESRSSSVLGFRASEQLNITSVQLFITVGKTEGEEEHEGEKLHPKKEDSDARGEFR